MWNKFNIVKITMLEYCRKELSFPITCLFHDTSRSRHKYIIRRAKKLITGIESCGGNKERPDWKMYSRIMKTLAQKKCAVIKGDAKITSLIVRVINRQDLVVKYTTMLLEFLCKRYSINFVLRLIYPEKILLS